MDYKKYSLVKDYENYIIFSTGKVYSIKRNIFLKPNTSNKGYLRIKICKNNKIKHYFIHQLIALHFIENPHNLASVDHIDRNKLNNNISNLRWSSRTLQNINKNIMKTNKTGITGVRFHKRNNSYEASWTINYKTYRKSFSLNIYKNAKQLAIDYREKMEEKHYKNLK